MDASDRATLEQTLCQLSKDLRPVARRFFVDPDDATEVMQQAVTAALRALDDFRGSAQLSTWFRRIVINTALMERRRRQRHPVEPLDSDREPCVAAAADRPLLPEAIVERREQQRLVHRTLAQLSPTHRQILEHHYLEDRDVQEVARSLRVTPTAVRVRLHRARHAMRAALSAA